jgi:hypothetical protein
MTVSQREKQIADAEEMLGETLHRPGFAKGLYFGECLAAGQLPCPDFHRDARANQLVEDLRIFCRDHLDPLQIDRDQRIPDGVIRGLGELGVLGACLPKRRSRFRPDFLLPRA